MSKNLILNSVSPIQTAETLVRQDSSLKLRKIHRDLGLLRSQRLTFFPVITLCKSIIKTVPVFFITLFYESGRGLSSEIINQNYVL